MSPSKFPPRTSLPKKIKGTEELAPGSVGLRKPNLQQVIGRVMQSHDESPSSDVIGKPGKADEDDGGYMVDDLFLEILQR